MKRFRTFPRTPPSKEIPANSGCQSGELLYALAILHHGRRKLVTVNVTANPTAEWLARQVTEAFP